MNSIYGIYDQISEMIAQLEPEKLLSLKASPEVQQRFDLLVEKSRKDTLSTKEKDELAHFVVLERLFRLSKIRADKTTSL